MLNGEMQIDYYLLQQSSKQNFESNCFKSNN